ncbi:RraA-like protein [Ustulina deusta]|nr:RraA-like protein [Ustulina deusta]
MIFPHTAKRLCSRPHPQLASGIPLLFWPSTVQRSNSRAAVHRQFTKMAESRDPIVRALQNYTTCDVSDALCKLKYRNGGFLSGLTMWSPLRQDGNTKIVGPAYTVKYVPLDDPAPKHPTHYIDHVPEGAVVFVSCPPKTPNAVYGGLMSTRAQFLGAVGSVIDGRFRDVQEQRDLAYPVFARDVGTAPPAELLKVAGVNVPVKLQTDEQDMEIRPGDYLIADINGVVVLPVELAEKALPLMQKQVEADEKMAIEIKKGMGFVEASRKFRL